MSLKLGSTTINGLYLGSTAINAVYLGSTQVFGGGGGGGPPANIGNVLHANFDNSNAKTHTYSGVVFPGGKVLVCAFGTADSAPPTCTINGVPATRVGGFTEGSGFDHVSFYEATVTAGTGTITITAVGANNYRGCICAWDVDGYTFKGAIGDAALATSINTSAGWVGFGGAHANGASAMSVPSGWAEDYKELAAYERDAVFGKSLAVPAATPQTFTWSATGGSTYFSGVCLYGP